MRVALFFGSFNPIHIGHLALANYVAEFGGVDEVQIVVSPLNPLKKASDMLPDEVRFDLVRKAVEGYPKIKAQDIEFSLPRPSYTYTTLTHLKHLHPENDYVLVIGADNVESFPRWRDFQKILAEFEVIVYPRLGYTNEIPFDNMSWLQTPIIEVSSTFIRESVWAGKDVRFFLPSSICGEAIEAIQKLNNKKNNIQRNEREN